MATAHPGTDGTAPPGYAWDWLARQRPIWREVRRELTRSPVPADPADHRPVVARSLDVPDWSRDPINAPDRSPDDAPDEAPKRPVSTAAGAQGPEQGGAGAPDHGTSHDYRPLDTRAAVIAALREDYPNDPHVRTTVDHMVASLAFLGTPAGTLAERGVSAPPRGMRWWWQHLGGTDAPVRPDVPSVHQAGSDAAPNLQDIDAELVVHPVQLRLVDVQTGYGDSTATTGGPGAVSTTPDTTV